MGLPIRNSVPNDEAEIIFFFGVSLMYILGLVYTVRKFQFLPMLHALNFINRSFGSLFWLLGVPIGSLFHKKIGPYWVPISKLGVPNSFWNSDIGDTHLKMTARARALHLKHQEQHLQCKIPPPSPNSPPPPILPNFKRQWGPPRLV